MTQHQDNLDKVVSVDETNVNFSSSDKRARI